MKVCQNRHLRKKHYLISSKNNKSSLFLQYKRVSSLNPRLQGKNTVFCIGYKSFAPLRYDDLKAFLLAVTTH